MSLYQSPEFCFSPSYALDFDEKYLDIPTDDHLSLPSPLSSLTSTPESGAMALDFDIDSFTHQSPGMSLLTTITHDMFDGISSLNSFDLDLDLDYTDKERMLIISPVTSDSAAFTSTTCSPISNTTSLSLISPRSSFGESTFTFPTSNSINHINPSVTSSTTSLLPNSETVEALSNHHLQRYLHYKALAAQAEADNRAIEAQIQSDQINSILGSCDSVPDNFSFNLGSFDKDFTSFQQQPLEDYNGGMNGWTQPMNSLSSNYDIVNLHKAQAAVHIQAYDNALQMVKINQQQKESDRFNTFYMPLSASVQPSVSMETANWSTDSAVTASLPTTPVYNPHPVLPLNQPMNTALLHSTIPALTKAEPQVVSSHNRSVSSASDHQTQSTEEDIKPALVDGMPIPNLHGGGRGYVPGKTPDDPKKRHKCGVCGRGFARAFNLKVSLRSSSHFPFILARNVVTHTDDFLQSHAQTHNPTRPKPFACPHSTCKRGFSRLHDLERHRQGIHDDGPLVESKSTSSNQDQKIKNVIPQPKAQTRIQRRAERGVHV